MLLKDYTAIENVSCVYKITHERSDNFYIGRTNKLKRRAKEHYKKLIMNKHDNPRMQNIHNKYGDTWSIFIIFEGSVDECTFKEQELLDATDLKYSLNCHLSSIGGSVGTEPAKEKVFALLDWAVANDSTRDEAIRQFNCSWDALKKYQPQWEEVNGKLELPLRATGEKSGNYKHGMSKETRRKRTEEELVVINENRRLKMLGDSNPMSGKTHSEEAKAIQSKAAIDQHAKYKLEGKEVSEDTRLKISEALKGKPKSVEHNRNHAMSLLGKLYDTPFGIFYTSKECEIATGIKAATVMWRCKNNYLDVWKYTTTAEVTTDASGFIVNQLSATNINVTSANYIFLAIA